MSLVHCGRRCGYPLNWPIGPVSRLSSLSSAHNKTTTNRHFLGPDMPTLAASCSSRPARASGQSCCVSCDRTAARKAGLVVLFRACLLRRCGEAWFWIFEEHRTFEGELRSTRRKVGENPRPTLRLPRRSAGGAGCVRVHGVFLELQKSAEISLSHPHSIF